MNTKDLAEAMIAGEFNYTPGDDAVSVATQYLKLHEILSYIVDNDIKLPPGGKQATINALNYDPLDKTR